MSKATPVVRIALESLGFRRFHAAARTAHRRERLANGL
jgi:hypothetical protein